MERGVSAMKKILLIMMTVTTALVMTACSGKTNRQTSSEDYKYSSYVYDDNEAQFYMSENAAASETGYYYITGAPVNKNYNNKYINSNMCWKYNIFNSKAKQKK